MGGWVERCVHAGGTVHARLGKREGGASIHLSRPRPPIHARLPTSLHPPPPHTPWCSSREHGGEPPRVEAASCPRQSRCPPHPPARHTRSSRAPTRCPGPTPCMHAWVGGLVGGLVGGWVWRWGAREGGVRGRVGAAQRGAVGLAARRHATTPPPPPPQKKKHQIIRLRSEKKMKQIQEKNHLHKKKLTPRLTAPRLRSSGPSP